MMYILRMSGDDGMTDGLRRFIDNANREQLVLLLKELKEEDHKRLIDYITSLLSA